MTRCPRCNTPSETETNRPHAYYCHRCQMEFEAIDDSDIGYGRPSKRLERKERQRERSKERSVRR